MNLKIQIIDQQTESEIVKENDKKILTMTTRELRRRGKVDYSSRFDTTAPQTSERVQNSGEKRTPHASGTNENDRAVTWVVTKWAILRLTGIVYLLGFLGAYYQYRGLMGTHGIQPAEDYFEPLRAQYSSNWDGFLDHPSVFWWMKLTDDRMDALYLLGIAISTLVALGEDSMIFMFLLWLLYFTIITTAASSSFYAYGWESQLLETGFLGMFLCDVFPQFGKRHRKSPPSPIILWLFRWLCFRISIGAGLIKIRGDSCWTQKTCLHYHFETQPIPSPMSFVFHFLPKWALTHAVDLDLFVQVYTSWFVLFPTHVPGCKSLSKILLMVVRLGGLIQAGFMVNIMLSGNFASLNHLTVIPALACLDDACWPGFIHALACSKVVPTTSAPSRQFSWRSKRIMIDILLLGVITNLSRPVISNLLQLEGRGQAMNASFDRFRLVNTYGAFGSVGKGRYEPILSISYDGENWIEIEFPCKPGDVSRRPCFCAPYHYRLDWNIWFIGFKPHNRMLQGRERWLFSLVAKILDGNTPERPWLDLLDSKTAAMLRKNYEQNNLAPRYATVDMFHYRMAAPLSEILPKFFLGKEVVWWNRTFEEALIPRVELDQEKRRLVRAR